MRTNQLHLAWLLWFWSLGFGLPPNNIQRVHCFVVSRIRAGGGCFKEAKQLVQHPHRHPTFLNKVVQHYQFGSHASHCVVRDAGGGQSAAVYYRENNLSLIKSKIVTAIQVAMGDGWMGHLPDVSFFCTLRIYKMCTNPYGT